MGIVQWRHFRIGLGFFWVGLAVLSIYLYAQKNASHRGEVPSLSTVEALVGEFQKVHSSEGEVSLREFPQASLSAELMDPKTALPQSQEFSYDDLTLLFRYSKNCSKLPSLKDQRLKKALQWHAFQCRDLNHLPPDFFLVSPFIHPSGSSYALLAAKSGLSAFSDEWIQKNWKALHLLELKFFRGILPLSHTQQHTLSLPKDSLSLLFSGTDFVLSDKEFLIRSAPRSDLVHGFSYQVFPIIHWDHFLRRFPYRTVRTGSPYSCLLTTGNVCWLFDVERMRNYHVGALVLGWGSVLLLLILLVGEVSQRMRLKKEQDEAKVFVLQTLTHELRTPVTSFKLEMEALRTDFDRLPKSSQVAFLRMGDELTRFDRLIAASSRYLSAHESQALFLHLESTDINEFLGRLLEPFSSELTLEPTAGTKEVQIDRYWLGVCLKNLVENALLHGKPPVRVSSRYERSQIGISVSDGGTTAFSTLNEMTSPHRKASRSKGLGLGLTITEKIVRSMKGSFKFLPNPTTFEIWLRVKV